MTTPLLPRGRMVVVEPILAFPVQDTVVSGAVRQVASAVNPVASLPWTPFCLKSYESAHSILFCCAAGWSWF